MGFGDKLFKGTAWSALNRISTQATQFLLGIILARILSPEEYGVLAILMVFIIISQVFVDSGFTNALIHKQDRDEDDNSTVFLFNLGIALACYAILWFAAPLIADFYEVPLLVDYLRVLAITLIINASFAVPTTLLTIQLDFKTLTKINVISVVISGLIAIYMAYNGFGVWSLVWQSLIRAILAAFLTWIYSRWKPIWKFSKTSFKGLFSYGSKLLVSALLANIFSNLNAILIGKYLSANALGFFSRGVQFSTVVYSLFSGTLNSVLLPGLAPFQDNAELLVSHSKKILKISGMVVLPILLGLAVVAEPLIRFVLTEKWMLAVPVMQIFCVARSITILSGLNLNLLYVIGRTDLVLRQQYLGIAIRATLVILALPYGIVMIALAELLATGIHFFINSYYVGKLLKYNAIQQIIDIRWILFANMIMVIFSLLLMQVNFSDLLAIIIIPIGAGFLYWQLIRFFPIPEYKLTLSKVTNLRKNL